MKPAFVTLSFNARRLPLTLAAACLGVGTVGLAATLYQPVGLSPFSAPHSPRLVAQTKSLEPLVMPDVTMGELVEAATPEATPEAAAPVLVSNPRPAISGAPAPATQPPAASAPAPNVPAPGAEAAGDGGVTPLPDYLPVPPPSKDEAGLPPAQYYNPAANPLPVPPGAVAGVLPEPTEGEPPSDLPVAQPGKD